MPITRIDIKHFKSINSCNIKLSRANLLIGENGSGKTNILDAIDYFFSNLIVEETDESIFDNNNRFSNEVKIGIHFDISGFERIAKTHINKNNSVDEKRDTYRNYYRKIIEIASRYNNVVFIEMTQIKNHGIKWNCSYEDRFVINSLFPYFHIKTRDLDIAEWKSIWDVIGDLNKVSNTERSTVEKSIKSLINKKHVGVATKLLDVENYLSNSDLNIYPANANTFATNLTKLYYSGNTFLYEGKKLNLHSSGTQTAKYLELLFKVIDELSQKKLKEPVISLDEPEISLHPRLIDDISNSIIQTGSKNSFLISTHSARMVKELILNEELVTLFNVKMNCNYTTVKQMRNYAQYNKKSRYRAMDDHVNSYFSKGILFVEGESELELFTNTFLKTLFPALKLIDVYKAMSDRPLLDAMNPEINRAQTPYILLIDMDKAFKYNKESKTIALEKEFIGKNDSELFMYDTQKCSVLSNHHRINRMADKLKLHYHLPYYSCTDSNYYEFIRMIQSYLLNYNCFALKTTIEGALVCANSLDIAYTLLKENNNQEEYTALVQYLSTLKKADKLNVLRLLFNGKTDLLIKREKLNLNRNEKRIIESCMISGKTSGWITDYLSIFVSQYFGQDSNVSFAYIQRYLKNNSNREKMRISFENTFPELFSLITILEDMVS